MEPIRAAPGADDAEGVRLLREALARVDFAGGLDRVLGRRNEPPHPGDELLGTLVRLLYLGASVPVEEAARAFAPLELSRLEAMGVVRSSDEEVEALLELDLFAGLIVAADPARERKVRPDHVLLPALGTRVLVAVSPHDPVERALDLATGAGPLALVLAGHAGEVVATDVNPRAVAFTAFNAALNGVTNVVPRAGSLFEPVAGERFDLVVSNPPYVISPDNRFVYRDSGLPGDAICESVVRRTAEHLTDGGLGIVLVNWALGRGEHWADPPRRWVNDIGCDAVLLRLSLWNPLGYATHWNSWRSEDAGAYGAALDRWLEHYAGAGIERVGGGVVVLRRRPAPNWVLPLEAPSAGLDSGEHVQRLIAAQDFLRRDGLALLDERLVPADGHAVDVRLRHRPGGTPVRTAHVSIEGGLGMRVELDEPAVELLSRLDPDKRLRDVADSPAAARVLSQLIELGFVVPAS